jgi:hypothetical protein
MRYAAAIAALAAVLAISPVSATVRISGDSGGQIGPYLKHLEAMRKSGERIVIDGPCLSACTMVLGVIPRNRICVTSRAQLGFHAAWNPDQNGGQVTSAGGTSLLMNHYPQHVRDWIARRGGLSRQMMYLSGSELSSMYASCDSTADESGASRTISGPSPAVARSPQARADEWRQDGAVPIGGAAVRKVRQRTHHKY